jgi:hypothetical protein
MMSVSKRSYSLFALLAALALCFSPNVLSASSQAQSQMRLRASRAAAGPIKLDIEPGTSSAIINSNVPLTISMRNADNQPATWAQPCTVSLEITFPSKKVQKLSVVIPLGRSSVPANFLASEYGVVQLRVIESTNSLSPSGNTVFIVPPPKSGKYAPVTALPHDANGQELTRAVHAPPRLVLASWRLSSPEPPPQDIGPTTAPTPAPPILPPTPQLILVKADGKDEVLADGKDFARIAIYYMGPVDNRAPADITILLKATRGTFTPQSMIIHKGHSTAATQLVSSTVGNSVVSIVQSSPNYAVTGDSSLTVSFVPAIIGFGPATSEPVVKMSLIDREPLVGCFFDAQGQCIQTDRKTEVHFHPISSSLYVNQDTFNLDPNASGATAYLQPTWHGTTSVEMWMPNHPRQSITVQISIWLVLTLCLVGGAIGGLVAQHTSGGSFLWRPIIGVVAGIVLVWGCVYAVVLQTSSVFAHSLIGVFVVGILGGFGGTRVLDGFLKKFGI